MVEFLSPIEIVSIESVSFFLEVDDYLFLLL